MTHLDLFSGIGGFALAARWAGLETIQFVEIEKFAQQVLTKNFPGIPIHDNIKTFNATKFRGCGLVTGGYPCQPFSQAGKRRGEEDDRHLWPEMFRVIREARPTWILCENVAGHITMGLDDVLFDLEDEGYACQTFVIPAVAKDARHRRDRVWIVAHPNSKRGCLWETNREDAEDVRESSRREEHRQWLPEPSVGRVVNGLPNRVDRLKGLGNEIVPQVAYEIMRCLK